MRRTGDKLKRHFIVVGILLIASAGRAFPAPLEDARRYYNHTDYTSAIAALKDAPDAASLPLLGQCHLMLGDAKRASEVLERAVATNPGNSDLHLWLGRAYGRRAETAFALAAPPLALKARQNLERAVEL